MEDYSRAPPRATAATSSSTRRTSPTSTLFETSGHLDWYADGMYPPMEMDNGDVLPEADELPDALLIFRSRQRSYRELPLRLFELGTVYRYERAGHAARPHAHPRLHAGRQPHLLHRGAARGRDRVAAATSCCRCCAPFGFERVRRPNLSTTDPTSTSASDEDWDEATEALRARARDARPRRTRSTRATPRSTARRSTSTCATPSAARGSCRRIQFDFNLPERFELEYVGADNAAPPADHDPPRAVRLDRAVLRRAARALRRRVPDVAGAGAGAGAAGARRPRGVRRDASSTGCAAEGFRADCGRGRRAARQAHPQGQAREAALRARRRRRRRRATARSASTRAAARSSAACRVDDFVERLRGRGRRPRSAS